MDGAHDDAPNPPSSAITLSAGTSASLISAAHLANQERTVSMADAHSGQPKRPVETPAPLRITPADTRCAHRLQDCDAANRAAWVAAASTVTPSESFTSTTP
jgi:hypothetical protein